MNTNRMQVSATGMSYPVLSPEHAARACIALDQPPSLHPFRPDRKHQFVHRLRWYYAAVRLPALVHHRRTSLDFSMRSQRAGWEERRISRFPRKLFPAALLRRVSVSQAVARLSRRAQ